MKKLVLILFALVFASFAIAGPPPAHGNYGGGWGKNPTNWEDQSGTWESGLCLYDPDVSDYVQFDNQGVSLGVVQYDPITIELWVELYMQASYQHTNYQFHRIANEAHQEAFVITGIVSSNQMNWCGLTPGGDDMNFLHLISGMYGGGGNIPINWSGRYGAGFTPDENAPWQNLTVGPNGIGFNIAKCDHWFQFRGCFNLPYHTDDGYYTLEIAGCPVPAL